MCLALGGMYWEMPCIRRLWSIEVCLGERGSMFSGGTEVDNGHMARRAFVLIINSVSKISRS